MGARRPGWNPARRNRNIGTARQGHGRDNRLVVPHAWPDDRVFYEVLRDPVIVRRTVGATPITLFVEPTRPGSLHHCTIDDVCHVLQYVPPAHLNGLERVVLRQPTRKQEVLRPVWGRVLHWTYGKTHVDRGAAIFLDAQTGEPIRWPRSLRPDLAAELERLREDGHAIRATSRHHVIEPSPASIRRAQLFRTLLHEVGHYVDWLESVWWPLQGRPAAEVERIIATYRARPHREREEFAHRYAAVVRRRVYETEPHRDPERLRADGLDPAWFRPG